MIEKWRLHNRLTMQPPGINHVATTLLVASEGVEPTPQEPKSCVRPSH